MNTNTTADHLRSRQQLHPTQLLQSRENGEIGSLEARYANASTLAARPAPVAKSWAHFVAGGYVFLLFAPFVD
jgi:solute carrier family 25 protein 33/36